MVNMNALTTAFNWMQKTVLDHPSGTRGAFSAIMRAASGGAASILNLPQAFNFGGAPVPAAIAGLQRGGAVSSANAAPGTLNVTVKAETDHPEGLAHRVATLIVEMMHTAGVHNQAQGQGSPVHRGRVASQAPSGPRRARQGRSPMIRCTTRP